MTLKEVQKKTVSWFKKNHYIPVINKDVYSTEETIVGTYIDGRPIYQKFITGLSIGSGTDLVFREKVYKFADFDITDYDLFTSQDAFELNGTGRMVYPWVYANGKDQTYFAAVQILAADKTFAIRTNYGQARQGICVRFKYVKTTDIGNANIQNVPFEPLTEYSTNEKMVGYWIDGKPLYRKTIAVKTPTQVNTTTDIPIGARVDTVVDLKAMFNYNNGVWLPITTVNDGWNSFIKISVTADTSATIEPNSILLRTNLTAWANLPGHVTVTYTKVDG